MGFFLAAIRWALSKYWMIWVWAGIALLLAGWYAHHRIYMSGWNDALAQVERQAREQQDKAQGQIEDKRRAHEKAQNKVRGSKGYNNPASPLVADAIKQLP